MKASALDQFLREEAAVGRVDSSGSFGMDLAGARRKLADFGLSDPAFALLKAVQAGVAAGSRKIEVRIYQKDTELTYFGSSFFPQTVIGALSDPLAGATAGHLLAAAVMTALGSEQVACVWSRSPHPQLVRFLGPSRPERESSPKSPGSGTRRWIWDKEDSRVVASAGGLETDLSGLAVVRNHAYEERVEFLRNQLRLTASRYDEALRQHYPLTSGKNSHGMLSSARWWARSRSMEGSIPSSRLKSRR